MKKQKDRQPIKNIDEYEQYVNLSNLISGGNQKSHTKLRKIIDQIETDRFCNSDFTYPSLLITGKAGKNTTAKAFAKTLCFDEIREIPALHIDSFYGILHTFSNDSMSVAYIIQNIDDLRTGIILPLQQILKGGSFSQYNYISDDVDYYSVEGMIVITANEIDKVTKTIVDEVDHIVRLELYTPQQLELIVLQRLRFAHIEIESDQILKSIVQFGQSDPQRIIRFLRDCYVSMRSEGRVKLLMEDVRTAMRMKN